MIEDRSQSLGKYKIHEELGRGAFATVYRALDTTLDREVALKILHPQLLTDPTFVGRFKREARAMANLDHQHIATVYEIGEAEERVYIAMQLARGPNLGEAIDEQGRFSWKQTLALLRPVCEALDYAHSKDLVHRDLKPSNVLLDPDGDRGPLLTDFGFARLMGDSSVSLSLSGGILGTPAYIAPEVWELDKAEPPTDVYALGCLLYEMLTGEVLFAGRTPMQAMRAHDQGPQLPREWPEDVPEGIETVLEKALARDPEKRYPIGMALWHALNDLEAQAQAAEEAAQQAAVAAQWREETEAAIAAGEWSVAKMAAARWLVVTPNDPDAQEAQAEIERRLAGPPAEEEEKEEEPAQDTVDCTACGHENRPGAQYCRACGHSLEVQPESIPETPQDIRFPPDQEEAITVGKSESPPPPSNFTSTKRSSQSRGVPSWLWVAGGLIGILGIGFILILALSGSFSGSKDVAEVSNTPQPSRTPQPTVESTRTSPPTATLAPSPRPTAKSSPLPTSTALPTSAPSSTPAPTALPTSAPSSTPAPTALPPSAVPRQDVWLGNFQVLSDSPNRLALTIEYDASAFPSNAQFFGAAEFMLENGQYSDWLDSQLFRSENCVPTPDGGCSNHWTLGNTGTLKMIVGYYGNNSITTSNIRIIWYCYDSLCIDYLESRDDLGSSREASNYITDWTFQYNKVWTP